MWLQFIYLSLKFDQNMVSGVAEILEDLKASSNAETWPQICRNAFKFLHDVIETGMSNI